MKRITNIRLNKKELNDIIDVLDVIVCNTKKRDDFNIFKWHCDNAMFEDSEWDTLTHLNKLLKNKLNEMN